MTFANAFFFSLPPCPERKKCLFFLGPVFTVRMVQLHSLGTGERGECLKRGGFRAGSFPSDLLARLEQRKGIVFPPPRAQQGCRCEQ